MKLTRRAPKCQRCGGSGRRRYVEGAVPVLDKNGKQVADTTVSGTVTCLDCNGTGQADERRRRADHRLTRRPKETPAMSEEEIEINQVHAELRTLQTDLADLAGWAERVLNKDYTDRQYIAEHLSAAVAALSAGEPVPNQPYDDADES